MSDTYKLQYNGMTLAYPGWNGYVGYDNVPAFKTLTLYASEGGTVTASVLTGMPGDTAQITTAYDTYYRFSGYDIAGGGSLNGDVYTFGDSDADISAVYKVNYFTATGNFNYANRYATGNKSNTYSGICKSVTGSIPSTYLGQSSAWKPINDVSAYYISATPSVRVQIASYRANFTGRLLINDTQVVQKTAYLESRVGSTTPSTTFNLSKDSTTTGSIKIYLTAKSDSPYMNFGWNQISNNGWTATGIAP